MFTTDMIKSNEAYLQAYKEFGPIQANNMADASFFDVSPETLEIAVSRFGGSQVNNASNSPYTNKNGDMKFPLDKGGNRITNNNAPFSSQGMFGDNASTGWVAPVAKLAMSGYNTYLAHQTLEETKKNNEAKLALLKDANDMKKKQANNVVMQAKRYAMLGMGNSNSHMATLGAVQATPYSTFV